MKFLCKVSLQKFYVSLLLKFLVVSKNQFILGKTKAKHISLFSLCFQNLLEISEAHLKAAVKQ